MESDFFFCSSLKRINSKYQSQGPIYIFHLLAFAEISLFNVFFGKEKNGIRDSDEKKCGMRDSREKGAGKRDQDPPYKTLIQGLIYNCICNPLVNVSLIRMLFVCHHFQECFNSPYGTQYFAEYAEEIPGESTNMLSSIAKETQCYVIGGSIPESDSGKLYNTSTSFGPDGTMLAKHRKVGSSKCI